jgi:hypothetical protein
MIARQPVAAMAFVFDDEECDEEGLCFDDEECEHQLPGF